jgi:Xaa-Pro aminopeptidase
MDALRLKRVREAMKKAGLDAAFVTNPKNVKYLTGFRTMLPGEVQSFGDPEGFALIHKNRCDFLCDGRYIDGARQLPGVSPQLLASPTNAKTIASKIKELLPRGAKRLGFEQDSILYGDAVGLLKSLKGVRLKPAAGLFASLRVCKTPEEIKLIRKAQAITSDCFDHMLKFIRLGMTERQVAMEIDKFLRTNSDGNSFDPIVAFGETSCQPHYVPSDSRKLKKGQMVLLDLGAVYNGYCGDMTRMVFMGKADARYRTVYNQVLEAQLKCLAAVKPGRTGHELDMIVRDTFVKHGCLANFLHGTGHGVGLAIHEDPRIKKGFKSRVEPGMVFSVEPGLYYSGWGGIRIEDLVVVTKTGRENITRTPKTLVELKG